MSPLLSALANRLPATVAIRDRKGLALVGAFHAAALAVMAWSEIEPVPMAAFILTWALINFVWLSLLGRPALSAALSLVLVAV